MKKILIILLLVIFSNIDNIYAKEIIVDNIKYDDSSNFEGNGYKFIANNKILYLDGYNGGKIIYDDLIQIRLNNINIINGNDKNGIFVKKVDIIGEGTLNIFNCDIGINSENLKIQSAKLYITKCNTGVYLTGNELDLYHSEIVLEECNIGIYASNKNSLFDSKMNFLNCEFGIYNDNIKKMFLNESEIYIYTKNYSLYNIDFDDITLSRMVLKSESYCLNQMYDYKSTKVIGYVSEDDTNYFVDTDYINYPFVKVSTKEYIEDLLSNDKKLILEVDKSFLIDINGDDEKNNNDNNNLNTITKGEYTDEEYTKVEIINPQTIDNIHLFILLMLLSILGIILTLFTRRENE